MAERVHLPMWDTWDPNRWVEVSPGVKVYAPDIAFRAQGAAMLKGRTFDDVIAYLRERFGRITYEEVIRGRRVRVEFVTQHHDVRPRTGPLGLLMQNTHETIRTTTLTRQGVPDLDRPYGRGHNGNRTSCRHATPGIVPTIGKSELAVAANGATISVWATYCTGCGKRLWDDRDS